MKIILNSASHFILQNGYSYLKVKLQFLFTETLPPQDPARASPNRPLKLHKSRLARIYSCEAGNRMLNSTHLLNGPKPAQILHPVYVISPHVENLVAVELSE